MLTVVFNDLARSSKFFVLWSHLGWKEIVIRYRRTALGPWWITLSMLIFIISLSVVYGKLFHQNVQSYLAFLFSGYVFWIFISTAVSESSEIFFSASGYIQQSDLPYFVYILKHMYKNILLLAHNILVYPLIILYCHHYISAHYNVLNVLLVIPSSFILFANVFWVSIIVSLLGSRFRDIPPIVASLLQIIFFVSPITWMPSLLGVNSCIIKYNPINYLIELVRDPLLGIAPSLSVWIINLVFIFFGMSLALVMFDKLHSRIPFWLI